MTGTDLVQTRSCGVFRDFESEDANRTGQTTLITQRLDRKVPSSRKPAPLQGHGNGRKADANRVGNALPTHPICDLSDTDHTSNMSHHVNSIKSLDSSYPSKKFGEQWRAMKQPYEDVADRILIILHVYGVSKSSFADRIGANRTQVSNWLSGTRRPNVDHALKIREVWGVPTDWLYVGGSEDNLPARIKSEIDRRRSGGSSS